MLSGTVGCGYRPASSFVMDGQLGVHRLQVQKKVS
jgi:hypothetical protein